MFSKKVATAIVVLFVLAESLLSAMEEKGGLTDPHFLDGLYAQLVQRAQAADPNWSQKQVEAFSKGIEIVPKQDATIYSALSQVTRKFASVSDKLEFRVVAEMEGYSGARLGDVVFIKLRVVRSFMTNEKPEMEIASVVAHEMGHGANDAALRYLIMKSSLTQAYKDALLCRVEAEADARSLVLLKGAGYDLKQAMRLQKNDRGRDGEPGHIAALHNAIVQEAYNQLEGIVPSSSPISLSAKR